MPCLRRAQRRRGMRHSSLICCRCPTTDGIPPSICSGAAPAKTLEAFTSQLEVLSRVRPVLCSLRTRTGPTRRALRRSAHVDRIQPLRVFLLFTLRPEFIPPWIGRPHVTSVTINRMGARDVNAIIDGVSRSKPIPASVRRDIIERTDGIPLFVEEMTKAVLEADERGFRRAAGG